MVVCTSLVCGEWDLRRNKMHPWSSMEGVPVCLDHLLI